MAPKNPFEIAKHISEQLERAWGNTRSQGDPNLFSRSRKMSTRYGPAKRHFQVRVLNGEVVIFCLTSTAASWTVIRHMAEHGSSWYVGAGMERAAYRPTIREEYK